jgi:nucleotide-binding universal stress UspA family protein
VASPGQPILFCYDGSDEARRAIGSVENLLSSNTAVVLTVWQPLTARLSEAGGFGVFALEDEGSIDEHERLAATETAEEAPQAVWRAVVDVADEIDAGLIVCGTRGRGGVRTALLGSTSRAVLQHAGRPVLVSPEPRNGD